ncbi:hypothetical protein ACOMHN_041002 [Nucella lapillus]
MNVRLEFYGVDFVSDNCQDMRVDIYRNGYVHTPMDLLQTIWLTSTSTVPAASTSPWSARTRSTAPSSRLASFAPEVRGSGSKT